MAIFDEDIALKVSLSFLMLYMDTQTNPDVLESWTYDWEMTLILEPSADRLPY